MALQNFLLNIFDWNVIEVEVNVGDFIDLLPESSFQDRSTDELKNAAALFILMFGPCLKIIKLNKFSCIIKFVFNSFINSDTIVN